MAAKSKKPVGAFVTYTGKEPDNGPGEALVIKKLFLTKEYDSIGVMNSTVALRYHNRQKG